MREHRIVLPAAVAAFLAVTLDPAVRMLFTRMTPVRLRPRWLGRLLGDTVRDREGQAVFDLIETNPNLLPVLNRFGIRPGFRDNDRCLDEPVPAQEPRSARRAPTRTREGDRHRLRRLGRDRDAFRSLFKRTRFPGSA